MHFLGVDSVPGDISADPRAVAYATCPDCGCECSARELHDDGCPECRAAVVAADNAAHDARVATAFAPVVRRVAAIATQLAAKRVFHASREECRGPSYDAASLIARNARFDAARAQWRGLVRGTSREYQRGLQLAQDRRCVTHGCTCPAGAL